MKNRVICIGDVHGCLDELKELLRKVEWKPDDRVIMVGDLVDRGPNSVGCVRFVKTANFECVAGNHDNKFARYYRHEKKRLSAEKAGGKKYKNPMRLNAEKQAVYDSMTDAELKWLSNLPDSIHLKDLNVLVVHAGVQPGREPMGQPGNVYRHCRYVYDKDFKLATLDTTTFAKPEGSSLWGQLYDGKMDIIHGHHVGDMEDPQIFVNTNGGRAIGIDTGCCFGGKLTAYVMDWSGDSYVQVTARKAYYAR